MKRVIWLVPLLMCLVANTQGRSFEEFLADIDLLLESIADIDLLFTAPITATADEQWDLYMRRAALEDSMGETIANINQQLTARMSESDKLALLKRRAAIMRTLEESMADDGHLSHPPALERLWYMENMPYLWLMNTRLQIPYLVKVDHDLEQLIPMTIERSEIQRYLDGLIISMYIYAEDLALDAKGHQQLIAFTLRLESRYAERFINWFDRGNSADDLGSAFEDVLSTFDAKEHQGYSMKQTVWLANNIVRWMEQRYSVIAVKKFLEGVIIINDVYVSDFKGKPLKGLKLDKLSE